MIGNFLIENICEDGTEALRKFLNQNNSDLKIAGILLRGKGFITKHARL